MRNFCLLLSLAGLVAACDYSKFKNPGGSGGGPGALRKLENFEAPDYATVHRFIIKSKCLDCHTEGGRKEKGVALDTYALVRKWYPRILVRTMETPDKPMPPGKPLSNIETQLLQNWDAVGLPEHVIAQGDRPDPTLEVGIPTWNKLKNKIFAAKCLDCHQQPNPEKNLDLTSYAETKEKIFLILDRVFVDNDMPQAPIPAVSQAERRAILKWFNAGMPE